MIQASKLFDGSSPPDVAQQIERLVSERRGQVSPGDNRLQSPRLRAVVREREHADVACAESQHRVADRCVRPDRGWRRFDQTANKLPRVSATACRQVEGPQQ